MTRPIATYSLNDLTNSLAVRENARYAWDSDYTVVVDARPLTRTDRVAVEQWLINNVGFYSDVIYA